MAAPLEPVGPGAAVAVLARLRWRQLGWIAGEAGRDRVAAAALLVLALVGTAGARRLFALEPPPTRFALEASSMTAVFLVLHRAIALAEGDRLAEGPFHILLARRGRGRWWRLLEVGAAFCALAIWLAAALLTLEPRRAPAFLLAALTGAGSALGAIAAPRPARVRTGRGGSGGMRFISGPWLVARLQWRRGRGFLPAWLLALAFGASGTLAAALAARNNPDPALAAGVLAATGLGAGLLLSQIDPALLRFTGREPGSLGRLSLDFTGLSAFVTTAGVGLGGALAGVPPAWTLAAALGVAALVLLHTNLVLLHALGGATRFPTLAAGMELAIAAFLLVTWAPLALFWLAGRSILLARSARRLRWREA